MYYLLDDKKLTHLAGIDTRERAIETQDLLKMFGVQGDLFEFDDEDKTFSVYRPLENIWANDYSVSEYILTSMGLQAFIIDRDNDPVELKRKLDAALEHIDHLESKLDDVQEAMNSHNKRFHRVWEEMMNELDPDKLLEAAFEDVDPDYQPFNQQED